MFSDIPEELNYEIKDSNVKFTIDDLSTDWLNFDDSFIERINKNYLNKVFLTEHLKKEINVKNILDKGIHLFSMNKYMKAIECFDEVLFYDYDYASALLHKSYSLNGQKHFVKALRYYKRAIKVDISLKDIEYHKNLIKKANIERDNFPKIKLNIYAGDEYFAKKDFTKAVECYNRALSNPSKFKDKILSKLLNKKATALLRLTNYAEALECFNDSLKIEINDYSYFGKGYCEYMLKMNINDAFKSKLNINKPQMLKQASVLNELGYYEESLTITDYLYKNHFKTDEFYLKLTRLHELTLIELDK